jgi:hypothetical protein
MVFTKVCKPINLFHVATTEPSSHIHKVFAGPTHTSSSLYATFLKISRATFTLHRQCLFNIDLLRTSLPLPSIPIRVPLTPRPTYHRIAIQLSPWSFLNLAQAVAEQTQANAEQSRAKFQQAQANVWATRLLQSIVDQQSIVSSDGVHKAVSQFCGLQAMVGHPEICQCDREL